MSAATTSAAASTYRKGSWWRLPQADEALARNTRESKTMKLLAINPQSPTILVVGVVGLLVALTVGLFLIWPNVVALTKLYSTDPEVSIALALGLVGLMIALAAGLFVVGKNAGSRLIVLTYSTLVGAAAVFAIQLYFELKGQELPVVTIVTELTVDHERLEIGPLNRLSDSDRMIFEKGASDWLAKNNPKVFEQDLKESRDRFDVVRLPTDLVMFSLINFIWFRENAWQMRKTVYASGGGKSISREPIPVASTTFTRDDVGLILSHSGNRFAGAPFLPIGEVWLPPGSKVELVRYPNGGSTMSIKNAICEISFTASMLSSAFERPKPGQRTDTVGIMIETHFFPLRAQNRDVDQYRAWVERVTADAQEWWKQNAEDLSPRYSSK
jgi:hypothetical protein